MFFISSYLLFFQINARLFCNPSKDIVGDFLEDGA